MSTETTTEILLAEGEFNWPRGERQGDRYGAVHVQLDPSGITPENADEKLVENALNTASATRDRYADFADAPVGTVGRMVAEVTESRPSYHIGDLFHGFRPPEDPTPVGERVELGHGELFREVGWHDGPIARYVIGLRPTEALGAREYKGKRIGPNTFWLDPEALYRVHAQTVRLYFVPDEEAQ